MRPARPLIALAVALVFAGAAVAAPERWQRAWPDTDFSRTSVPFDEIIAGGPPKDGIPAIDDPAFRPAAEEERIADREPVMTLEFEGAEPRAYPIRYLMWHEIVNDTVAGRPVAVTFCPLCNTGMVFDGEVNGQERVFGVSGLLRHSVMIMFDRETESWWQQGTGEGIVGAHTGDRLELLPAWMESWQEFRARNPDGLVMAEPDWPRRYGDNPYRNYDTSQQPFLFDGADPPHGLDPMARMVRVGERAWPMARVREAGEITEAGVTITWREGQASALDTGRIGDGREVGTVRVRDAAGNDLPHDIPFAFAFNAFHPDGEWMLGR